jgi:hypothetical protein
MTPWSTVFCRPEELRLPRGQWRGGKRSDAFAFQTMIVSHRSARSDPTRELWSHPWSREQDSRMQWKLFSISFDPALGDIRAEGPRPFSSSGGNSGNGRTRTAMHTDGTEQRRRRTPSRGSARDRAGSIHSPSSGGWITFGESPSRRPVTLEITGSRRRSLSVLDAKMTSEG